jgi:hypothetical protein
MRRCRGMTRSGKRCLNSPVDGTAFCAVHRGQLSSGKALLSLAGAAIGNVLLPGLGGILLS